MLTYCKIKPIQYHVHIQNTCIPHPSSQRTNSNKFWKWRQAHVEMESPKNGPNKERRHNTLAPPLHVTSCVIFPTMHTLMHITYAYNLCTRAARHISLFIANKQPLHNTPGSHVFCIASFPGLSTLQFLINYSMLKWRGEAWSILSYEWCQCPSTSVRWGGPPPSAADRRGGGGGAKRDFFTKCPSGRGQGRGGGVGGSNRDILTKVPSVRGPPNSAELKYTSQSKGFVSLYC